MMPANLSGPNSVRGHMTFLQKLFSKKQDSKPRVRVCVECGMPVADHKDWCSIFRTQKEMDGKTRAARPQQA
jgi:hypothetical protein